MVSTENGLKKIEEIEIGDKVWSFNEETKINELKEVVTLFRNNADLLIEVSIDKEKIICTIRHPFFVNNSWVEAKNLKIGDKLSLKDGKNAIITNLLKVERQTKVYNFEVKDNHNYYVSELGVLVHNDCILRAFRKAIIDPGKGKLSPAGRALDKHRNILRLVKADGIWDFTSGKLKNHYGKEALKYIMRNGTKTENLANPHYTDFKLPNGLGARFNTTTEEFVGFLGRGL